ncbi:MAG TPA: phosphate signaling complex protein PhoU [Kiloniellales bacterium]|nr:phosphate signaling complex protein PhoU [Kiloniellales bacterium]
MHRNPDHIVKAFDQELEGLGAIIGRMGGLVEAQLAGAIEALTRRDTELAGRVIEGDSEIDALEEQLDEAAIRLLALRQPMADDLRQVIAALRISSDLERIGDYAANIAKRTIAISRIAPVPAASAVPRMARLVQAIIKDTLDAYAARDAERAIDVWHRDEEVDAMYTALFRELLTYMMEDPRNISSSTHLLFIAKNIERMGDHATNIAETIHYLVTGKRLAGGRPKGDTTSFQVFEPPDSDEPAGDPGGGQ